jgi:hypothetical protein
MRAALGLMLLAGCSGATMASVASGNGADGGRAPGEPFIASGDSFAGFRDWEAFVVDTPSPVGGGTHTQGVRTMYLLARPPSGARLFPVGTMIVKSEVPDPTLPKGERQFAMVKRGGGYNASGASGWEYFELDGSDPVHPTVLWAGTGPPIGDTYNGEASCNACHVLASASDYVQTPALAALLAP